MQLKLQVLITINLIHLNYFIVETYIKCNLLKRQNIILSAHLWFIDIAASTIERLKKTKHFFSATGALQQNKKYK